MKTGILAAMEEELRTLRASLDEPKEHIMGPFRAYTGYLEGEAVVLVLCGIGKVNAAVAAALLIHTFAPDQVLNTGVAGGFPPEVLRIGDIVLSTEVRHHDADATIFNYEYGQIPRMPPAYRADPGLLRLALDAVPPEFPVAVHSGQILSGDSFVHAEGQIREIGSRFPQILAVEMEGAAIAQTCHLFNLPFLIIRSVSDLVQVDDSHAIYEGAMEQSAENSVALVLALLRGLHGQGRR